MRPTPELVAAAESLTPELRQAFTVVFDLAQQNMDHHYCGNCGGEDCENCQATRLLKPFTIYND